MRHTSGAFLSGPLVPVLPLNEFARVTGQTIDAVRQQAKTGRIPTLQGGPHEKVYVNLVAMWKACDEAANWDVHAPSHEYSL